MPLPPIFTTNDTDGALSQTVSIVNATVSDHPVQKLIIPSFGVHEFARAPLYQRISANLHSRTRGLASITHGFEFDRSVSSEKLAGRERSEPT
jgi:hypothetical protein